MTGKFWEIFNCACLKLSIAQKFPSPGFIFSKKRLSRIVMDTPNFPNTKSLKTIPCISHMYFYIKFIYRVLLNQIYSSPILRMIWKYHLSRNSKLKYTNPENVKMRGHQRLSPCPQQNIDKWRYGFYMTTSEEATMMQRGGLGGVKETLAVECLKGANGIHSFRRWWMSR